MWALPLHAPLLQPFIGQYDRRTYRSHKEKPRRSGRRLSALSPRHDHPTPTARHQVAAAWKLKPAILDQLKPHLTAAPPGETWDQTFDRVETASENELNARDFDVSHQ